MATAWPQHVTVHGREEVVVVGADDFRRLAGDQRGALQIKLNRQHHLSGVLELVRTAEGAVLSQLRHEALPRNLRVALAMAVLAVPLT